LVILCSGILNRHFYEVYLKLHFTLAALVIAVTYIHINSQPKELWKPPAVYLLAGILLQILIAVTQVGQIIYRNINYKEPLSFVSVRAITYEIMDGSDIVLSNAVLVYVYPVRDCQPKAGQYIYLCIPGATHTSFTQLHPFYVSWYQQGCLVLVVQKQKGFTSRLFSYAGGKPMKAIIEGPYGKELYLDEYGTVLLFATGIGISGQLPYVTQLLEGYQRSEVKTRRIALFWELESECKYCRKAQ
jgi:predicted ferric reductase